MSKRVMLIIASVIILITSVSIVLYYTTRDGNNKQSSPLTDDRVMASQLKKQFGVVKTPLFTKVEEDSIQDQEQKNRIALLKKVPGVHRDGDLFLIVPKKDKNKIRLVTEVHQGKAIEVYFKKIPPAGSGNDYFLGTVKGLSDSKELKGTEVWIFDAETKEPIQLEDLDKEIARDNGEISNATTIESSKK